MGVWAAFFDEGKETGLTFAPDRAIKHGDGASFQIRYHLAPESWATCSLVHDQPRDWSDFQGLSLYVHAERSGQAFTLVAYGGTSSDDLLHFERRFQAGESAVTGWQRFEIRWDQLKPAPWQGDAEERFDPRSAMGVALGFDSSDGAPNAGRLWIDDVTLLPAGR